MADCQQGGTSSSTDTRAVNVVTCAPATSEIPSKADATSEVPSKADDRSEVPSKHDCASKALVKEDANVESGCKPSDGLELLSEVVLTTIVREQSLDTGLPASAVTTDNTGRWPTPVMQTPENTVAVPFEPSPHAVVVKSPTASPEILEISASDFFRSVDNQRAERRRSGRVASHIRHSLLRTFTDVAGPAVDAVIFSGCASSCPSGRVVRPMGPLPMTSMSPYAVAGVEDSESGDTELVNVDNFIDMTVGVDSKSGSQSSDSDADGAPHGTQLEDSQEWGIEETLALIQARVSKDNNGAQRLTKGDWNVVEAMMHSKGFDRSIAQCKLRWKNVWSTYKEIWDHETRSGRPSYWAMSARDRALHGFTIHLAREWYDELNAYNERLLGELQRLITTAPPMHHESPAAAGGARVAGNARAGTSVRTTSGAPPPMDIATVPRLVEHNLRQIVGARPPSRRGGNRGSAKRQRTILNAVERSLIRICETAIKCSNKTAEAWERHTEKMLSGQKDCAVFLADKMDRGWKLIGDVVRETATQMAEDTSSADSEEFVARCRRSP
ncbi:hypothetical protein CBR_g1186 [Chara braunii]|uniref:Myb-like domain-containing protein n=1 Tax=Chara braunii TaxID=69332 RepID=A0A388KDE0_CHABU|nr:hypothetical protein CBR_g1186 [Chara braunii]|eukprot:GBG68065.1 hypothetical protein CBR_g1186 [Chara braunii]